MKLVAIPSPLMLLLTSCALIEPTASVEFKASSSLSTETVFTCAERTIFALHKENAEWRAKVTSSDLKSGLFETGDFKKTNITGIRVQINYTEPSRAASIKVKASGPYFVDLGAEHAATELKNKIIQCMAPN